MKNVSVMFTHTGMFVVNGKEFSLMSIDGNFTFDCDAAEASESGLLCDKKRYKIAALYSQIDCLLSKVNRHRFCCDTIYSLRKMRSLESGEKVLGVFNQKNVPVAVLAPYDIMIDGVTNVTILPIHKADAADFHNRLFADIVLYVEQVERDNA